MQLSPTRLSQLTGSYEVLKAPAWTGPLAQRDPKVVATVSEMLGNIERNGMDAVLRYAKQLDHWESADVELDAAEFASSGDRIPAELRAALELGSARTKAFAQAQRDHLVDFEVELAPGVWAGQRYVPVPGSVRTCRPAAFPSWPAPS